MKILYYIYQICIALPILLVLTIPHGNRHYCRFSLGRSPHLGILSGEDLVTINLSVSIDSRED